MSFIRMKVIILGSGGPLVDLEREGPSYVFVVEDQPLLMDCGRGATKQIVKAKIKPNDIKNVFITHHHYDHISDLGDFVLTSWLYDILSNVPTYSEIIQSDMNKKIEPISIYGPKKTDEIVKALFQSVYKTNTESMLKIWEGYKEKGVGMEIKWADPEVHTVNEGLVCRGDGWKVTSTLVDHWKSAAPGFDEDCLAFRVDSDEGSIVYSGDVKPLDNNLIELAEGADILIHDCYIAKKERSGDSYSRQHSSNVHTSSGQVGKVAESASVKKLVLSHIRKKPQKMLQSMVEDAKRDFDGEVILAEDLKEIKVD